MIQYFAILIKWMPLLMVKWVIYKSCTHALADLPKHGIMLNDKFALVDKMAFGEDWETYHGMLICPYIHASSRHVNIPVHLLLSLGYHKVLPSVAIGGTIWLKDESARGLETGGQSGSNIDRLA